MIIPRSKLFITDRSGCDGILPRVWQTMPAFVRGKILQPEKNHTRNKNNRYLFTAPFNNMQTLKFKIQPTVAVNH